MRHPPSARSLLLITVLGFAFGCTVPPHAEFATPAPVARIEDAARNCSEADAIANLPCRELGAAAETQIIYRRVLRSASDFHGASGCSEEADACWSIRLSVGYCGQRALYSCNYCRRDVLDMRCGADWSQEVLPVRLCFSGNRTVETR